MCARARAHRHSFTISYRLKESNYMPLASLIFLLNTAVLKESSIWNELTMYTTLWGEKFIAPGIYLLINVFKVSFDFKDFSSQWRTWVVTWHTITSVFQPWGRLKCLVMTRRTKKKNTLGLQEICHVKIWSQGKKAVDVDEHLMINNYTTIGSMLIVVHYMEVHKQLNTFSFFCPWYTVLFKRINTSIRHWPQREAESMAASHCDRITLSWIFYLTN